MANFLRIALPEKDTTTEPGVVDQEQNEKLLWQSFKGGSESAFISIYKQNFQILYNYGCQLTGDTALIKDCIQDVFIALRRSRTRLAQVSSIKAYLLKSIRRKILKEIKRSSVRNQHSIDEPALNFEVIPSTENLMVERQFQDDQLMRINEGLNRLSKRQREAIYYYYYNDLSYREIKEIMSFSSIEAARNLIYRALSSLKRMW